MKNITKYANRFGKKAGNFLDNPRIKFLIPEDERFVKEGCRGYTELHEKHLPEFFLWLSKETRQMVLEGKSTKEILEYLETI